MRTKPIELCVITMGKHQHTYPNTQREKNKDKVLMVMYAVADIINKINIVARHRSATEQLGQSAA
jgi:hypothetical protein